MSAQRLQAKAGTRQVVLIDSVGEQVAVARSHSDAPGIDGVADITACARQYVDATTGAIQRSAAVESSEAHIEKLRRVIGEQHCLVALGSHVASPIVSSAQSM